VTRTALVTGAAGGIGSAIARALADGGYRVGLCDSDPDVEELGAPFRVFDIADRQACEQAIAELEQELGAPFDTLVAAAAVVDNIAPAAEFPPEAWERELAVNLSGAFWCARVLSRGMAERGFGRIVFLSSVSAERGGGVFGGVAYSAAKAAQLGFAKALAREVGPHGITVNSVAPGLIDTDITGGALEGDTKTQLLAGIHVGRNGQVTDVADLITYLCRAQTGYITGATYDINGGSHMH